MRILMLAICLLAASGAARGKENTVNTDGQRAQTPITLFSRPKDIMEGIPADFPRFHFPGHSEEAQLLSRYLWYHFANRLGNGNVLFNKEYLTISDLWMAGAVDKSRGKSIQEVHREDLSSIKMDAEGYVYTHQHISHAHDHGWPFPFWTQADTSPDRVNGKAAGWHFQASIPGFYMVSGWLNGWKRPEYCGETATQGWELHNVKSLGVSEEKWHLEATGESPTITTPAGMEIDSFQAPFLQLRLQYPQPAGQSRIYVEWLRDQDTEFGDDRRVYVSHDEDMWAHTTRSRHLMFEMWRHPKWTGKIKRVRISLAPGLNEGRFAIDSFFTVYDTRHTINNPILILACWNYFTWTGDLDFLRHNINRMRSALRWQQTVLGGLEHNHIRDTRPGHDGLPGWTANPDGSRTIHGGHGIGGNYWDILPFGWDDMYATNQYYFSTLTMAEVEEAVASNPGWGIPRGESAFDPVALRRHAAEVKRVANRKFWDSKKGRFIACIDSEGKPHDYGFTFLNLDSIWYGLAADDHAAQIMDWIDGKRVIKGDTSTGADIYRWRFGPRATTLRNVEWYGQGWLSPESIPWGGQVQDGGAVLGFAFYDLWARLKVLGPGSAWQRLTEILKWDKEVAEAGGYREYYKDGKAGTTLQGGGTAGGIGVDAEFFESSLIPSIVIYGFLGLDPGATSLRIDPSIPDAVGEMGVSDILYRGCRLDVKATNDRIMLAIKTAPRDAIRVTTKGEWTLAGGGISASEFCFSEPGVYVLDGARQ